MGLSAYQKLGRAMSDIEDARGSLADEIRELEHQRDVAQRAYDAWSAAFDKMEQQRDELRRACCMALPVLRDAVACGLYPQDDPRDRLAHDAVAAALGEGDDHDPA